MRRLLCASIIVLAGAFSPSAGEARETSVLEGVNFAVIMPVDLASSPANAECGLNEALVIEAVQTPIQSAGLRTEHFVQMQPFALDTPGVYLIPTIATLRNGASGCVTWLGLRAQSAHTLTLPSTQKRKTIQVLYWDRGVLLSSPIGNHPGAVAAALRQLAADFGEQWRRDQR